ncbi:MAG: hypothetical protein J0H12_00670 [Candidatus Paracaedimonas acanthamoebae]|uniref:Uncharacterized protein n=1 Tax=Candidatus Paracaedimonas acanthamoebae TaxID=244581 RepID=A0A8J7PZF1_9PROT|nr:hypothetical protein [Candidatus Paracaedimonas acanthamoebae]
MGELLHGLRIICLNFFERTSHAFFETTIGQKVLILLAPFFLLPGERLEGRQGFLKLFNFLHMQAWAPILGGVFFSSALTVLLRTFQHAHVPFIGIVDVEAFSVLFWLTIFSSLLGYIFSLTKFITPYVLNFFIKDEEFIMEPMLFWTTRYGGFLMFFGVFAWFMGGLIALKLSFFPMMILMGVIVIFGYAIRKELLKQQQKFIETISPSRRPLFLLIESIILITFSLVLALIFYYI